MILDTGSDALTLTCEKSFAPPTFAGSAGTNKKWRVSDKCSKPFSGKKRPAAHILAGGSFDRLKIDSA